MAFVGKVEEDEKEDVEKLDFPAAFNAAEFLTNAEVAILLEDRKKTAAAGATPTPVFTQAVAYVEKFSGGVGEVTRTQDAVVDIRQSLASLTFTREDDDGLFVTERLHAWEVVSLANLNPGSVEEALAIIPSLARFREDDVSKALETLATATSRLQM